MTAVTDKTLLRMFETVNMRLKVYRMDLLGRILGRLLVHPFLAKK